MSYTSTNISSAGFTEDYDSPTTNVWLDESDALPDKKQVTWQESDLKGWAVPIPRNISAFETIDVAEDAILEKINTDELREILVIHSFPDKSWLLHCTSYTPELLPYIPVEKRHGLSYQQTCFFPVFFDIRRCARYIMGSTPVSNVEQPSESERNVAIIIHPEVILEAEEENLTHDLDRCLELIQENYPSLRRIEVNREHDPEILDRKTIRFTLTVSGDPVIILQNEALFKQELRSSVGPRARELITVTYRWNN